MREQKTRRRLSTRLTALLLAAVMMLTAAPVVVAVSCGDGNHRPADGQTEVVAPTCGAAGYTKNICSVCGEEYHTDPTEPTGKHSYQYISSDTGHKQKCTVCEQTDSEEWQPHSYTEQTVAPTCTEAGYTRHTCVCGYYYDDTPVEALGHDFATSWSFNDKSHWHDCGRSGCAVKNAEAAHVVESWTENTAENTRSGPCKVCGYIVTEDLRPVYTVTFKNGTATVGTEQVRQGSAPAFANIPTYSGVGTGTFLGWSESAGGVRSASTAPLDLSKYQVSKNITLYAVYNVSLSGKTVKVELDGTGAYTFSGSLSNGSAVSLLNGAMRSVGSDLTYVTFGAASSATYGTLYTNSGRTALSTTAKYYYSSLQNGNEPLNKLYFVPTGSAGTYGVAFTGYDAYGNSVSGLLAIVVPGESIQYSVNSNATVKLSASDFNTFFRKTYSTTTPRWIVFEEGTGFSSTGGYLYYDYGGSNEKRFTNTSIDNYNFYYDSSSYGDFAIGSLSFVPGTTERDYAISVGFTAYYSDSKYVSGVLRFNVKYNESQGTITYETQIGTKVALDRTDFDNLFQKTYSGYTMRYLVFDTGTDFGSGAGYLYYNYGGSGELRLTNSSADDYRFYYSSSSYGSYPMSGLSFVPGTSTGAYTVSIDFTAYYSDSRWARGTLKIKVSGTASSGKVTYETSVDSPLALDKGDFNTLFQKEYSGYTMRYLTFDSGTDFSSAKGYLYYDYGGSGERRLTNSSVDDDTFYYSSSSYGSYPMSGLSFVPGTNTGDYTVSVDFTAYYSSTRYVSGTLLIRVTEGTQSTEASILYKTTKGNAVGLRAYDFYDLFQKSYPGYEMKYVVITGVPATGSLYYSYNGSSKYGSSGALKLTKSNCDANYFYYDPASTTNYSLEELTYVPSGSNYCVSIPFKAVYSSARTVTGTVLISVTGSAVVGNVYYAAAKGSRITLSGADFNNMVKTAVGSSFSYLKFTALPSSAQGTLFYKYSSASSYGHKVSTSKEYTYSGGAYPLSSITFVPAASYTGSLELPFIAYDAYDDAIAAGKLYIGVVKSVKSYSDVSKAGWYYQYVVELSDDNVIGGYPDGTFKPVGSVTWGEALKLVMLASGYSAQTAPANRHWAYGYMTKAKSSGLISGDVSLNQAITRVEVAELAAKALKLSSSKTQSPFADTSNGYVLALYRKGIVEGSLDSKGVQYYKPSNTITRSELSTIIWRINRRAK